MKKTLKRIVSWALCLMMVMSLAPGGIVLAADGKETATPMKVEYNIKNFGIDNDDDYLASKTETGFITASITNVLGYGVNEGNTNPPHNWCFYGAGSAIREAMDKAPLYTRAYHFNENRVKILANYSDTSGNNFDVREKGGNTLALSLKAPAVAGFYKAYVYRVNEETPCAPTHHTDRFTAITFTPKNKNDSATDLIIGVDAVTKEATAYLPKKVPSGEEIDNYVKDTKYQVGYSTGEGVIYVDGTTDIIFAVNVIGQDLQLARIVLEKVDAKPELNKESSIIEVGASDTIKANVGETQLLSGYIKFTSGDEDVATVSPEGVVTGVADGTTTVEVTVGDFKGEVEVKVGTGVKVTNFGEKSAYIREEVLGQVGEYQLRLLSGIDALKYQKVGFKVSVDGGEEETYETTKVYKQVNAKNENGGDKVVKPADFGEGSNYIFGPDLLVNVKANTKLTYTPFAIDLNAKTIYGKTRTIDNIFGGNN